MVCWTTGHPQRAPLDLVSAAQSVSQSSIHSFRPPGNLSQQALVGSSEWLLIIWTTEVNGMADWELALACSAVWKQWSFDSSGAALMKALISIKYHKNRGNLPWEALNMFCSILQLYSATMHVQHVVAHCETMGGLNQLAIQQHPTRWHNFNSTQLKQGRCEELLNLTALWNVFHHFLSDGERHVCR